jgi:hypothetical protein
MMKTLTTYAGHGRKPHQRLVDARQQRAQQRLEAHPRLQRARQLWAVKHVSAAGRRGGNRAKLVSPAVTNGAAPMGLAWLDSFFAACSGCQIDAVAIHIYDSATNIAYFKNYISSGASCSL